MAIINLMGNYMKLDKILILDLKSNFSQLLARKIRELNVYSIVENYTYPITEIKKHNVKGIILLGDLDSKIELIDKALFDLSIPFMVIGSCKQVEEYENIYKLNIEPAALEKKENLDILKKFIFNFCKCSPNWEIDNFIKESILSIKEKVGNKKAILALSGGVDSSVCAVLLSKAIGKNLTCVFVDHGLLRKNEALEVENTFKNYDLNFIKVDAKARFYQKLKGVVDPEEKRKIIGNEFILVFEEVSKNIEDTYFLVQGTIYPDIIESGKVGNEVIKSHHNVGGLPDVVNFKEILEPLKLLFKDEVRNVGKKLGLPLELINRQPFPGPGLAVRIIGEVNEEKIRIVQDADFIFREEIKKHGLDKEYSQYFACLTNLKSVGIKNGKRTYENAIALRAIITNDFMNASVAKIPYDVLEIITTRIINEVEGVNRVLYDFTPKPPSTIEFE